MQEVSQSDIDTLYRTIGTNVMCLRKAKGMSQLELALAIGLKSVGLVSVAEIYHNKKHFNIEHLYKISIALDVKISDFFEGVVDIKRICREVDNNSDC
ncbi:helix-turn-helix transcriptional regulator [Candidatus Sulfurimonas marisnigri]|uniref:Helix-turn-helix transcriptional regulator n=1 Tax=Candidatus Sulfurimonas marisnigri TaxID=2740405 RepID=A0A7S7LZJ2_9BACT|nr:helix-turn-helix transcriptional regulator [Candidatus Sulfurimonas marisnigri]QOY54309.1 helix-turn-helix transcriptional regulator [Candidatus Sulfurimonas marisnigri]